MRLVGPPGFQSHLSALVLFCQLAHLIFTFTFTFVLPSSFYFLVRFFSKFSPAEPPPMCARPFSMLWHGRKSGAATLTRSCARWSCCPCLALALEVWAKMVCSSDLFPDDFQLLQLKTWKNTFSSLSLYMFLCQMVLLSMSFPCSWCLVPDGGVATFFPDVLDLHWLAHLKILEMDPFLAPQVL